MESISRINAKNILNVVKGSLALHVRSYVVSTGNQEYRGKVSCIAQDDKTLDWDNETQFIGAVDPGRLLKFIIDRPNWFRSLHSERGWKDLKTLLRHRNMWAHDYSFTACEVMAVSEPALRLLKRGQMESATIGLKRLVRKFCEELNAQDKEVLENPELSDPLRARMAELKIDIDRLTDLQFLALRSRHKLPRKVAIGGCAGSGKSVIAAKMADEMGRWEKVLVLCHNPNVAYRFKRELQDNDGVTVRDIYSWVASLVGQPRIPFSKWTPTTRPDTSLVEEANLVLQSSGEKYYTVIVDEAQDFIDDWWILILNALENIETGRITAFFDRNQTLLPNLSDLGFAVWDEELNMNCRNGGRIVEETQKFCRQLLVGHPDLSGRGEYQIRKYDDINEIRVLRELVIHASKEVDPKELIVLTNDPDPVSETSDLGGLTVDLPYAWRWQSIVHGYLAYLASGSPYVAGKLVFDFNAKVSGLRLSDCRNPCESDIGEVVRLARSIEGTGRYGPFRPVRTRTEWHCTSSTARLRPVHSPSILQHFCDPRWPHGLITGERLRLRCTQDVNINRSGIIPLMSVNTFKGLDESGCITMIRHPCEEAWTQCYVGLTRGKLYSALMVECSLLAAVGMN